MEGVGISREVRIRLFYENRQIINVLQESIVQLVLRQSEKSVGLFAGGIGSYVSEVIC